MRISGWRLFSSFYTLWLTHGRADYDISLSICHKVTQAIQRGTHYSMDLFKSILDPAVNPQLMCKHSLFLKGAFTKNYWEQSWKQPKKDIFAVTFTLCVNKSTPGDNNSNKYDNLRKVWSLLTYQDLLEVCLQLSGAKNRMTKIKRDREEDRFEFPVLCYEKKKYCSRDVWLCTITWSNYGSIILLVCH